MATFWTYDCVCSLHDEWTFLLRSRWTKVKGLYIIARYIPFFIIIVDLYLNFGPNEIPNKCLILSDIHSCLAVISLACSECFFVLRTCALWNSNRIVLVVILSTLFAITVVCIGFSYTTISTSHCLCSHLPPLLFAHIHSAFTVTTSAIPGIPGCYWSSDSFLFFMPFILLFVFELGLVSLTLVRVIQNWRSANGPLYAVLLKHNIFYYACSLFLSGMNVLVPLLYSYSVSQSALDGLQVFVLAILATRMHLHLWHMDQHVHSSDALEWISMSGVSLAGHAA
ncbi:hypothetical protein EDB19DRAFT_163784 [Suillus lakei]|nr:hypothetical protein EDB19DRAFT_163784 [Suillus lakei]